MSDAAQYVTLGLGQETFGLPVSHVREILDLCEIARLPQAPAHFLGIIDVRGSSVPVVDLRLKLGLPSVPSTPGTRILVLEVTGERGPLVLGLVADRVFEVTGLDQDQAEPPPEIGGRWRADCVTGIGRRSGTFVILLNLKSLFADDSVALKPAELGNAA